MRDLMCIKPKAIILILVGILLASGVSASVSVFADLDDIANDNRISFKTAKQEIQELIEGITDPIRTKSIIFPSRNTTKIKEKVPDFAEMKVFPRNFPYIPHKFL